MVLLTLFMSFCFKLLHHAARAVSFLFGFGRGELASEDDEERDNREG
jgi:hypothetical protein